MMPMKRASTFTTEIIECLLEIRPKNRKKSSKYITDLIDVNKLFKIKNVSLPMFYVPDMAQNVAIVV